MCGCGKEVSVCVCERVWYGKERGRKGEGGKKKKKIGPINPPNLRSVRSKPRGSGVACPRPHELAQTHARTRNYTQRDTHTHTHTHTYAHPSTRTSPSRARACFGQDGTCLATSGCDRAVTRRMEPMKQIIYMSPWRICQQEKWRGGRPACQGNEYATIFADERERERDAIARDLRTALTAYSSKASNRIDRAC